MSEGTEPGNPPTSDVQPATQAADVENNEPSIAVTSVLRQWKREALLEKCTLLLRALCLFFSFISFVIMAANKHGDEQSFNRFQEYQYLLAIAILAFLYTMGQVVYQVYRLSTEKYLIPRRAMGILDFAGDQVAAYLLMSAISAAIPVTYRIREVINNSFTDSSVSSISMAFLAFLSIALSALISGYKLSTLTYI